jgi:hypothetical protein
MFTVYAEAVTELGKVGKDFRPGQSPILIKQ